MKNNQDYQLRTSLIVTLVTISATSTPGPERLSADDDSFHRQDAEPTTNLTPQNPLSAVIVPYASCSWLCCMEPHHYMLWLSSASLLLIALVERATDPMSSITSSEVPILAVPPCLHAWRVVCQKGKLSQGGWDCLVHHISTIAILPEVRSIIASLLLNIHHGSLRAHDKN